MFEFEYVLWYSQRLLCSQNADIKALKYTNITEPVIYQRLTFRDIVSISKVSHKEDVCGNFKINNYFS